MNDDTTGGLGRRTRWLGLVLLIAVVASGCTGGGGERDVVAHDDPVPASGVAVDGGETEGGRVLLRLQEGQAEAPAVQAVPVVDGAALTQGEIDAIVDRLPPFDEAEGDREEFNRPAETLPPPVAGETVATAFPPADGGDLPPDVPDGPLEVVRYQPDGEVDIAPSLSITFNQPMVPLATLEQLDEADVPAAVTPELPGRWRWIGTRTLRFEHTSDLIDRLPMATEYSVTFRPAPRRRRAARSPMPSRSPSRRRPRWYRPSSRSTTASRSSPCSSPSSTSGSTRRPCSTRSRSTPLARARVRLATDAEIEADDEARPVVSAALEGRWVAFRPVDPLPADTPLTVTFGAGTPSAEGPRTTTGEQVFRGRTFPPLTIVGSYCGYGDGCHPGDQWRINFTNPLDAEAFDPAT